MKAHSWAIEATGIPPWPGARVYSETYGGGYVVEVDGRRLKVVYGMATIDKVNVDDVFLAFDDPDTLAAFDRRLALRLGASESTVCEGVTFFPIRVAHDGSIVWVLQTRDGRPWLGTSAFDTTDPLLARVRAWKSR